MQKHQGLTVLPEQDSQKQGESVAHTQASKEGDAGSALREAATAAALLPSVQQVQPQAVWGRQGQQAQAHNALQHPHQTLTCRQALSSSPCPKAKQVKAHQGSIKLRAACMLLILCPLDL